MELRPVSVSVPAKIIYSGEHAVVRGGRAVVAPFFGYSLKLSYSPGSDFEDSSPLLRENIDLLLRRIQRPKLPGTFQVESSIPLAAGLGSSAALSVALAQLLDLIDGRKSLEGDTWRLALEFENQFHGTSSGLDPAGVLSPTPVLYQRDQGVIRHLPPLSCLELRLIDSGLRAQTVEVIESVKKRFHNDPLGLRAVDQDMDEAVALMVDAFEQKDQERALDFFVRAFDRSHDCFVNYGLLSPELVEQRNRILQEGALSAKLTGKGLGGYWLALFRKST